MTINCKGNLIDLSTPKVMGIVNITPDSFFDGGKHNSESSILKTAEQMLNEGATFLDVGGYSSRPGANDISLDEEKQRVLPAIELILKSFPEAIISIDTFRSEVAKDAISAGAALINDISAGNLDLEMINLVAKLQVPYVMMHMKGKPKTMQSDTNYKDLIFEINKYFSEKLFNTNAALINDIILDPGFGFAKTTEQNFELLSNMELLKIHDRPILAGVSRKSMIYKTLKTTANEALNGTTALNMIALQKGANILRVHDVKPAVECISLFNQLNNN